MTDMDPTHLRTNMGMGHFQPGDITHAATGPVPQGKQRGSSPTSFLLNKRAENEALIF